MWVNHGTNMSACSANGHEGAIKKDAVFETGVAGRWFKVDEVPRLGEYTMIEGWKGKISAICARCKLAHLEQFE